MKLTITALFFLLTMPSSIGCGGSDDADGGDGDGDGDGPDAGFDCNSGCTSGAECLAGTSDDACGSGGAMCQACTGDTICQEGACVPESIGCDASNCDGCCDGDVCLSGTSGGACGSDGAACADCGGRGICAVGGTCEVDPDSRWTVVAIDAVLPEANEGGGAWDPLGGLPDGFCRGFLDDDELGETDTDDDTLTPTWNQPIAIDVRADNVDDLVVEVRDDDVDASDLVGRCTLPEFPFEAFGGEPRDINCPNAAGWDMRIRIEPD